MLLDPTSLELRHYESAHASLQACTASIEIFSVFDSHQLDASTIPSPEVWTVVASDSASAFSFLHLLVEALSSVQDRVQIGS